MCDDVTDDVCQGCLLIALPSKTGPDIDDGESTWSCEVRCRGGRVRTVGRAPGTAPSTLDAGVQDCAQVANLGKGGGTEIYSKNPTPPGAAQAT